MSQTDVSTDASQDYYAVLTDAGSALEAEAHAKGVPVKITHIAVGDGNGEVPEPSRTATGLVNEVYRREIDSSRIDPDDPNICWISAVIPADAGGFWIREFGIYAEPLEEDGEPVLYGYGNHAPYYKVEKILGQASTHELEIPIIMTGQASIQIAVKDSGYASQSALNNLAGQVGQMRITQIDYGARIEELEDFDASHDVVATLEKDGHVRPDGATISIRQDGTIFLTQGPHYQVGELYHFLNPHPRPGMVPVYGTVIENVSQRYPEAWEYFQTTEGQAMCVTEEEWQEMSNAVYWTSTGAQVEFGPTDPVPHSWDGIGGAPAFVLDLEQDSLRVPDMRGMFAETTGGPGSAEIGRAKHDHIRGMRGLLDPGINWLWPHPFTGLFTRSGEVYPAKNFNSLPDFDMNVHSGARYMIYNNGHNTPVGAVVAPRRYGVLSCVYLGLPGQVQEEEQAGNQEGEQEVEA